MNELEFKKNNKMSACTTPPWAVLIPFKDRPQILRTIRNETIEAYSYPFDECPKRLTCFGKSCEGRPLPWESETARPYLEELAKTQKIVDGELFVNTKCDTCPIFNKCKSPCNQVLDFIDRDKKSEPSINFKNDTSNLEPIQAILEPANLIVDGSDIPWDILTARKADIIRKYLYEERDYKAIAEELGYKYQARTKYEFYSAINKLAEYAAVRKFLKSDKLKLTDRQFQIFDLVYNQNMTFVKASEKLGISKQSVQQTVSRILKRYKVKWHTYVKKRGNKVIYSVPELFK